MSKEFQQDEESGRRSHRRRYHLYDSEKFEAEVKAFTENPDQLAREILSLKKEMRRLHEKVKNYQQSNRRLQVISLLISLLLLIMIAYQVFLR
jgi:uncharacterized membrane protein